MIDEMPVSIKESGEIVVPTLPVSVSNKDMTDTFDTIVVQSKHDFTMTAPGVITQSAGDLSKKHGTAAVVVASSEHSTPIAHRNQYLHHQSEDF